MPELTREELGRHVVAARIAGTVQTPVADVLRKAERVAAGDPEHCFGLSGMSRYSPRDVLDQVTAQFGWIHTEGEPLTGPTWIDPELLLNELDRAADRLALAARNGESVLFATGHPTGVLSLHQQLCAALRGAGAKVTRPADGTAFRLGEHRRQVRYVQHVAVLASGANLYHTHDAHPMELVLDQAGEVDLVVADHGWAGAAAERGIDVVGLADVNDPALPMAKAEGRAGVVLPMDDNVLPVLYDPLADYLISRLA
jgi:Phosphatase